MLNRSYLPAATEDNALQCTMYTDMQNESFYVQKFEMVKESLHIQADI